METEQEKQEREAYVALLKEQEAFMRLHWNADSFTYDNSHYLLTATYHSPIHKRRDGRSSNKGNMGERD